MKANPTNLIKAGLLALALQPGTIAGALAGGPATLRLPIESVPIPASEHTEKAHRRSTFLSFMRLPGGRDETLYYLSKMRQKKMFPVGTQVALIGQAFLISDQGEWIPSPLVVSVSLRASLDLTRRNSRKEPTQSVAEFVMQPHQLMQGNAVMKALDRNDHRHEAGIGDDVGRLDDPFEADAAKRGKQSPEPTD